MRLADYHGRRRIGFRAESLWQYRLLSFVRASGNFSGKRLKALEYSKIFPEWKERDTRTREQRISAGLAALRNRGRG